MVRRALVSGVLTALVLVAGCSSAPDAGDTGDDANIAAAAPGPCGATPCNAANDFEQAKTCDKLFAAHAEIRQADLDEGILRWKCGDVDGVLQPELGQEYCEYHAVAVNEKTKTALVVDNANDLGKAKGTTVQCLYSSVYNDVRGRGQVVGNIVILDPESEKLAKSHVTDVAKTLNVTTIGPLATISGVEGRAATAMYGKFNARGAATQLLSDCSRIGKGSPKNADRTAACYLASKAATAKGDSAKAKQLETACAGVDLSSDATFAKIAALGVKLADPKDDAAFQNEKDIAACLGTKLAGAPWRNSDPTICARASRASAECDTTFGALPAQPNFIDGFEMTGWNGRSLEGTGCKYVDVAGKPYHHMVLCTPPEAEITKAITRTKRPLQHVCNDLFGNIVAMQAPIGAVATTKASATGAFCGSFNKGVAAIKAKLAPPPKAAAN